MSWVKVAWNSLFLNLENLFPNVCGLIIWTMPTYPFLISYYNPSVTVWWMGMAMPPRKQVSPWPGLEQEVWVLPIKP